MAGTNKEFDSEKLPPVLTTEKGHLNQENQKLHSTKNKSTY